MGGFKITPQNVRAGADRIGAKKATVTGIAVPDAASAMAGLTGFATAGALTGAHDAVKSALTVVGAHYEQIAQVCRDSVTRFEQADSAKPGTASLPSMLGGGLSGMGNLNRAIPALR